MTLIPVSQRPVSQRPVSLRPVFLRRLVLSVLLFGATPALARPEMCVGPTQHAHLSAFRAEIAAAESPEAARALALNQTRLGHVAIGRAARILPANPEIAQAEATLSAFDARVREAQTQEQVALEVDRLADSQSLGGGCSFTNVEVVIIVIGFLLGILPGILFLFLFC